jgi:hypothetical protein
MTTTELETLNLIQPMDDTRREMYIRARARIVSGEQDFICWALLAELADTCNGEWSPSEFKFQGEGDVLYGRDTYILLEELFPEFFALYDGKFWPLCTIEETHAGLCLPGIINPGPHDAWFDYLDKPRRLRLLDFLITHR